MFYLRYSYCNPLNPPGLCVEGDRTSSPEPPEFRVCHVGLQKSQNTIRELVSLRATLTKIIGDYVMIKISPNVILNKLTVMKVGPSLYGLSIHPWLFYNRKNLHHIIMIYVNILDYYTAQIIYWSSATTLLFLQRSRSSHCSESRALVG